MHATGAFWSPARRKRHVIAALKASLRRQKPGDPAVRTR